MPELNHSSELAEARRRRDELESLVEISPVAIVVMDAKIAALRRATSSASRRFAGSCPGCWSRLSATE